MAMIPCPDCGQEISDKAKKCIHCGKILIEEVKPLKYCAECGKEIEFDATDCPFCGCPVEAEKNENPAIAEITKTAKKNKKPLIIAAGIAVAHIVVAAAAAPDDDQQDDDPAAVVATKTVVAHIEDLLWNC